MRASAHFSRPSGSRRSLLRAASRRRFAPGFSAGFSFVEVLFAVMILGIGFIMLAAMFPVALNQVQTGSDESVSAAIAWNAMTVIQEKFSDPDLPPVGPPENQRFQNDTYPGVVRSFRDPQAPSVTRLTKGQYRRPLADPKFDPKTDVIYAQQPDYLWNRIKGESTVVDDRRFAWVGFYQRYIKISYDRSPPPYAQVIIAVARARETPAFGSKDVVTAPSALLANLQPRPVTFDLTSDGSGPIVDQVVRFKSGAVGAVAEGTYLIVAHDALPRTGGDKPSAQGYFNCNVFRVGNPVSGDTWELSPETPFVDQQVYDTRVQGLTDAEGYVIGRAVAGKRFVGVAQDVAVYSMIVPVR
jgi:type II secretory pathway pseudopilin PulG